MAPSLHEFLRDHRSSIIDRCRNKILQSSKEAATRGDELTNHLPEFLNEVIGALARTAGRPSDSPLPEQSASAVIHGQQRFRLGFDIAAVVHDYGALCEAITDVAIEKHQPIGVEEYQMLNQSLDTGIAEAVSQYAAIWETAGEAERRSRLGFLGHELRNAVSGATLAFEQIRRGTVPAAGRTAAVVQRCLGRLHNLTDRLLIDIRLQSGNIKRERLELSSLLEDIEAWGVLEAERRGVRLLVRPEPSIVIHADPQLLTSAITNLVQNAIKFTRTGGTVELRARLSEDRALIEVEDECGGLPDERVEELFLPFTQKSSDRSGLGLGLVISRQAVERNGGRLTARNLPGKGCIFAIDLPGSRR